MNFFGETIMEKAKASVAKNAVYQTIYNVLATITPLITTPIISRVRP